MKLRYVLVALVLATTAACQSSPTALDATLAPTGSVRLDDAPAPDPDPVPAEDTASRAGSGWAGNGN